MEILLCDGKHMEFSTMQLQHRQRFATSTGRNPFFCSCRSCQLESSACAVFPQAVEVAPLWDTRMNSQKSTFQEINNPKHWKCLKATPMMIATGVYLIIFNLFFCSPGKQTYSTALQKTSVLLSILVLRGNV